MTKRMLIDATHAEETRVVVLDGSRLDDFDVETATKRQLKGNIYLAKVVRVEPSLQAAFVEYGGNRHGFLAFGEIHPDYYQIPVADRQRLLAMEAEDARREAEEEDRAALRSHSRSTSAAVADADPVADEPDNERSSEAAQTEQPAIAEGGEPEAGAPEAAGTGATGTGATGTGAAGTGAAGTETEGSESAGSDSAGSGVDEPEAAATIEAAAEPPDPVEPGRRGSPRAQPALIDTESVSGALDATAEPLDREVLGGHEIMGVPAAAAVAAVAEPSAEPVPITVSDTLAASDPSEGVTIIEVSVETAIDDGHAPAAHHGDARDADTQDAVASDADARDDDSADYESGAEGSGSDEDEQDTRPPETVGGDSDAADDARERRIPPRFLRNYKIQEVIHRRQILLVQVVKEERGTKGAALTTYISLAGRYCVLMPNSPRGGGISRKITSATDRRRLKEVTAELEIPDGMGLIVRTAGANRPKPEIKRDCEYLMRLWDDIREHTMKSVAPALIYEEASLIKRTIRDVYARDIDEILVDGEEGWKAARDFMRMLMPSHVKKVQLWREPQPLFARHQVEAQLDAMLSPTVQLRSGGYLVINQTEALVAIDVNSGRSTRERGIEETALRTNIEAVDEVARQLRLRDLAGLIVIDLIDMESRKNNAVVERRLTEALKIDRARIQVGHISHFGLMEMSRQRLRPSLAETSFVTCPHCGGLGHVRGTENAAIHVLRDIEEEGAKRRAAEILVRVAAPIAMYIFNHKRARLAEIEARYTMQVTFAGDDSLIPPQIRIERVRAPATIEGPAAITPDARAETERVVQTAIMVEDDVDDSDVAGADDVQAEADSVPAETDPGAVPGETSEEADRRRRRRRRRRRGGRREDGAPTSGESVSGEESSGDVISEDPADAEHGPRTPPTAAPGDDAESLGAADLAEHIEGVPEHADASPVAEGEAGDDEARGRRRGRRGGRRRRRDGPEGVLDSVAEPGAEQPVLPIYTGPTPANPFGGEAFDIFDVLEQAERALEQPFVPLARTAPLPMPASEPVVPAGPAAEPVAVVAAEPALEPALEATSESAHEPPPETALEPISAPVRQSVPAPVVEPVATEVEPPIDTAPEPVADPSVTDPSAAPMRVAPVPANDAKPEALIAPIVIGGDGDAPEVEKKRGWWRR